MAEPSEKDTDALRIRARERIEQGRLPRAKAIRTWGGLGTGLRCDLCDAAILSSEPEFELQLDLTSTESVRLHRQCHAIWNEVREEWQPGGWRSAAREPPPFGVVVEARVQLGEARSIILSVVWLSTDSAAGTWINATTGGPLPEGWRPVEWRPPTRTSAGSSGVGGSSAPGHAPSGGSPSGAGGPAGPAATLAPGASGLAPGGGAAPDAEVPPSVPRRA